MTQHFSPASDATLTTDNVAEVIELVNNWDSLTASVIIPRDWFNAIDEKCSTKRETANECASYYVQCHPQPSWTHFASCLYYYGEFAAVDKLKPHLPLRGKHLVAMATSVYMEINHFHTCSTQQVFINHGNHGNQW